MLVFPDMAVSEQTSDFSLEEVMTIPTNYTLPNLNYDHFEEQVHKMQHHLTLPKCTSNPVFAYDLDQGEEQAFPHLFPLSINGYKQKRILPIKPHQYIRHCLYYSDARFRLNMTYLLNAVKDVSAF